jgi:hypothetical protein
VENNKIEKITNEVTAIIEIIEEKKINEILKKSFDKIKSKNLTAAD